MDSAASQREEKQGQGQGQEIMDYCVIYIGANGAIMVLVLAQLLRMERRLGCGGTVIEQVKKRCPLFNGNNCKLYSKSEGETDGSQEKVGQDRRT